MKGTVRIIGGLYRGKKIHFPSIDNLRPTSDRVRETLFNWLMHDIQNAKCLDAFAGSGALGFEALSRGAAHVLLIESSAQAMASLKENSLAFKNSHTPTCRALSAVSMDPADKPRNVGVLELLQANTLDFLKNTEEQFDIIFLDPPFKENYLQETIDLIQKRNLLKTGGYLYVESAQEPVLDPNIWKLLKSKKAGQVLYALFST
jgi:16S rRNA (guanine966-N2)-methyltransferase